MKIRLSALLTLLMLLTFQLPAYARSYVIEVVLFKHDLLAGLQEETWPDYVQKPDLTNSIPLDEYTQLQDSSKSMKNIAYAINRKGNMETIAHLAWIQPVSSKSNAKPVHIQAGKDFGHEFNLDGTQKDYATEGGSEGSQSLWEVEGTITTYAGRFLHFSPNLILRLPQEKTSASGLTQVYLKDFKLSQTRKMRSRELHYLDHPLMGMIVSIRPYN